MGLFTSKKNLCPICGSPTPRLLATKVEGMPICKECDNKIDIPNETVQAMSLNEFKSYLAYYDENAALRAKFRNEYTFDVNGWNDELQFDYSHGLFRLSSREEAIVFEGSCIRSFRILEDGRSLYEGSAEGLRCQTSKAPERLEQLSPLYNDYLRERREYERMKMMAESMNRDRDRDRGGLRHEIPEPRFEAGKPVEQYRILLTLDHPYRPEFQGELDGPDFSFLTPDLVETERKYENLLASLDLLAKNLMRFFAPNAPIQSADAGARPAQAAQAAGIPADAVTEIQRYKALVDQGILTEEEFAAKKRQLLGI